MQSSAARLPHIRGGAVVIAGSCSLATNAQVAAWREAVPPFRIDPVALAAGEPVVERAIDWATAMLGPRADADLLHLSGGRG